MQIAVDTENHLIVTHEVTTTGTDRSQLARTAKEAKAVLQTDKLEAVADRGYYHGEEILACEQAGIAVTLPKPMTSGAKAAGRFRQAGLHLSAGGRRLSVSRRRAAEVLLYQRGKWADAASLVD